MITLISIYLTVGLIIAFLVDMAYLRRDAGNEYFQDITGEMTWGVRILTIVLWPAVLGIAIVLFAKEKRGKNNGD